MSIYVAVVAKLENEGRSKRPEGDWASFIGRDRASTVKRALDAAKKWGGGYKVLVGQLPDEVGVTGPDWYLKSAEWPVQPATIEK